jgi:hypothetical protein
MRSLIDRLHANLAIPVPFEPPLAPTVIYILVGFLCGARLSLKGQPRFFSAIAAGPRLSAFNEASIGWAVSWAGLVPA